MANPCYILGGVEKTLLQYVLDELQARKGTWPKVAAETGLDYSWLTKLALGQINNPSVHKIQALADYFMGAPCVVRLQPIEVIS